MTERKQWVCITISRLYNNSEKEPRHQELVFNVSLVCELVSEQVRAREFSKFNQCKYSSPYAKCLFATFININKSFWPTKKDAREHTCKHDKYYMYESIHSTHTIDRIPNDSKTNLNVWNPWIFPIRNVFRVFLNIENKKRTHWMTFIYSRFNRFSQSSRLIRYVYIEGTYKLAKNKKWKSEKDKRTHTKHQFCLFVFNHSEM